MRQALEKGEIRLYEIRPREISLLANQRRSDGGQSEDMAALQSERSGGVVLAVTGQSAFRECPA